MKNTKNRYLIPTFRVRVHARADSKLEDYLKLIFGAGELTFRWNQIYPGLLNTYEKLKKLNLFIEPENKR